MSTEPDRIAVPTNGKGPHSIADDARAPAAADETGAGGPTDEEMSVAFTPKQLAVGFGILASLVVLIVGAARRRAKD